MNIQVVDDDIGILQALQRLLRYSGCNVDVFEDVSPALAELNTTHYDVIIADLHMPKLDGISFLAWARQKQPQAKRLLLSGKLDAPALIHAINHAEIYRCISKPWQNDNLRSVVMQAASQCQRLLDQYGDKVTGHQLLTNEELAHLESLEPGITQVQFDEDGALILDFSNPSSTR